LNEHVFCVSAWQAYTLSHGYQGISKNTSLKLGGDYKYYLWEH